MSTRHLSYNRNGQPIDVAAYTQVTLTSWLSRYLDRGVDLDRMRDRHAEHIAELADDIAENGIRYPVVLGVTEQGGAVILDGHHRMLAAEMLDLETVPVVGVPYDEHDEYVTDCGPIRVDELDEFFRPSDVLEEVPR